jgi:AAHS family benzoate transporter-like MFS transporter
MIVSSSVTQFTVEMTFTGVIICAARFYAADIRLTGVAWVTGVGRIGAIVGPYTGGVLMSMAIDRSYYVAAYAGLALFGALAIGTLARMNTRAAAAAAA